MGLGLFGTLGIGVSGLEVNQAGINVTGHNIASGSTPGYSRQAIDVQTNTPYCVPGMNSVAGAGQYGTGSHVQSVKRIRDSFLDYQIRNESSNFGRYNTIDTYLSQVQSMFQEPSDTGLSAMMTKFFSDWSDYATGTGNNKVTIKQIITESQTLANDFNHTYNQMQKLKSDLNGVQKQSVFDVNSMLDQIGELNQQIMQVKIGGQEPNDLEDRRDSLLDDLSKKFGIDIDKSPKFDGQDITPQDDSGVKDPKLVKSIDNDSAKRFSFVSSMSEEADQSHAPAGKKIYDITYNKLGNTTSTGQQATIKVALTDAEYKKLDENRILWADNGGTAIKADGTQLAGGTTYNYSDLATFAPSKGEIAGVTAVQQDIDDYTVQLNKLAKGLALAMNSVESGMNDPTGGDGTTTPKVDAIPYFVNSDFEKKYPTTAYGADGNIDVKTTDANYYSDKSLTDAGGKSNNWEDYITAGNISINQAIVNNNAKLKVRATDEKYSDPQDNINGGSDQSRALTLSKIKDIAINMQGIDPDCYSRKDLVPAFTKDTDTGVNTIPSNPNGTTIADYFKNTVNDLGVKAQDADRNSKNETSLLNSIKNQRNSVSGVSLDEEMASLIQFQHGYQANAKVITTVSELLDVVIGLVR